MAARKKRLGAFGVFWLVAAAVSAGDALWLTDVARSGSLASPERRAALLTRREDIFKRAPFASCHASTIVETPTGLAVAWCGGTAEGNPDTEIWLSRYDGATWTPPAEVAAGRGADGASQPCWNPVLFLPTGGPLFLFYKVGPNPSRWWGMMTTSEDEGRTWAPPRHLPEGIYGPIKNHPVELPAGTILCGSSTESDGWRVHFEWTRDHGRTWQKTAPINDGRGIGLIQPALLRLGSRRLAALLRSTAERVYITQSEDGGRTWSHPEPLAVPNPNSGLDAVTLGDGRQVLVCNPTPKGRSPLSVFIGADGRTWTPALTLEDESGEEFSYPAVIQTEDGLVHITYTWKRRGIRHAVVDPG